MGWDERHRSRARELDLEQSPEACVAACQAALREGDPERARDYLRLALEHFPRAKELLDLVADLSPGDPWPAINGKGGRRAGPFPGPERGIQRWRSELPGHAVGPLRVDAFGGVWFESWGCHRVDATGCSRLAPPSSGIDFGLEAGQVVSYDSILGERILGAHGWPYERTGSGDLVAWGSSNEVEGGSKEGLGWRRRFENLRFVAVGETQALVVGLGEGGLVAQAIDAESGEDSLRIRLEIESPGTLQALALPVAGDERWLIGSGARLGLYGADLRPRWERSFPALASASSDGRDLLLSVEDGLHALDLATGATRWSLPSVDLAYPPVLDGRGWAYVVCGGSLLAFDRQGQRRLRVELGSLGPLGEPALGGPGRLYLAAGQSVVCIA